MGSCPDADIDPQALYFQNLFYPDSRTKDGEDIIVMNPSKILSKRDFTGRKEYNEIMARLLL